MGSLAERYQSPARLLGSQLVGDVAPFAQHVTGLKNEAQAVWHVGARGVSPRLLHLYVFQRRLLTNIHVAIGPNAAAAACSTRRPVARDVHLGKLLGQHGLPRCCE